MPNMKPDELIKIINNYDGLVTRSMTKVTKEVIEASTRLKVIGRAGVGVDNIDIPAATAKGIVVLNTPEGNTMAATRAYRCHADGYDPPYSAGSSIYPRREMGPQVF